MGLQHAFADIDKINRAIVLNQTFGHLKPKRGEVYKGNIVYTLGCHGDITMIDWKFGDLPGSPWLHEHLTEFVGQHAMTVDEGTVWEFVGTYRTFKNGTHRFTGKFYPMKVSRARRRK